MSYLIANDFKKLIQTDNLSAISGNDTTLIDQVTIAAITEVKSYLVQKYETANEFISVVPWIRATAYKGRERVYLDATTYNPAIGYAANVLTLYAGNVYICNASIDVPEAFTPGHWTLIGPRYAMFYVTLPYPEFDYATVYAVGDQVWWNDKTYTCKIATKIIGHDTAINYPNYKSLPSVNVAPDDTSAGVQYWGTGVAYSVAAATLPTDATKWTAGDGRNAQLVNTIIDVALYTIHSRISPINIPDLRVKRYDDAIKWLKNCAKGTDITADLPLIKPSQGSRIRWGSTVRKNTQY